MFRKLKLLIRKPWQLLIIPLSYFPKFSFLRNTQNYQNRVSFEFWFNQKVLGTGGNRSTYWPVEPSSQVVDVENIYIGVDSCPGLMKGCYIQGRGGIHIDDYTQIGPNVSIISSNHIPYDSRSHVNNRVHIGKYCWIGAGATILPGVILGDFTIVGAGAIVTKSFTEGYCIIVGNPASKIKSLEVDKCIKYELLPRYHGYLTEKQFADLRLKFPTIY